VAQAGKYRLTLAVVATFLAAGGATSSRCVAAPQRAGAIERAGATPHPAVVRVVVDDGGGSLSLGSGVLVDVRDQFGLVVTNWHVVRDAQGAIEVRFPGGFQSTARAAKLDSDWDLAALVIWRPPVAPVPIATTAPQPGDPLTICGYGAGQYRAATGRCTRYYAPRIDYPLHVVELNVAARQGDSGGPIFNARGELAGVLFGSGSGGAMGSYGGRVQSFLATLAPDIGRKWRELPQPAQAGTAATPSAEIARADAPTQRGERPTASESTDEREGRGGVVPGGERAVASAPSLAELWRQADDRGAPLQASGALEGRGQALESQRRGAWFERVKNVLATIGAAALACLALRAIK
jgi:hypothetical protein